MIALVKHDNRDAIILGDAVEHLLLFPVLWAHLKSRTAIKERRSYAPLGYAVTSLTCLNRCNYLLVSLKVEGDWDDYTLMNGEW